MSIVTQHILVITLSNIGDVVMTFPVLDILRQDFPEADLSVMCGPKARPLLDDNPAFNHVYTLPKRAPLGEKIHLVRHLRRQRFDLVIDLKNSALPFLISPRRRTSPFLRRKPGEHMRRQHLRRLASRHPFSGIAARVCAHCSPSERGEVTTLLQGPLAGRRFVVMAPGAADENKRWPPECFARLADHLATDSGLVPVFVGAEADEPIVASIRSDAKETGLDLCGRLSLPQLSELIKHAALVVSNDSSPQHLASYLDMPVLALFGPTDPRRYGPWSSTSCVVQHRGECPACHGEDWPHQCMGNISVQDVIRQITLTPDGVRFRDPWRSP